MSKRERQHRYKTTGGASDLVKVETLVPRESREQVLRLAADLRRAYRTQRADVERRKRPPVDVTSVVAKLRDLCRTQARRYAHPIDIDALVTTSVNVPFPRLIDAATLAKSITEDAVPPDYAGHFERFLGEAPLVNILRFCDRHHITARTLARFVRNNRVKLALRRPDLDEHLNALLPGP